jgi:hypothetical protein
MAPLFEPVGRTRSTEGCPIPALLQQRPRPGNDPKELVTVSRQFCDPDEGGVGHRWPLRR